MQSDSNNSNKAKAEDRVFSAIPRESHTDPAKEGVVPPSPTDILSGTIPTEIQHLTHGFSALLIIIAILVAGMFFLAANDKGEKELYFDGDAQGYSSFEEALTMKTAKAEFLNISISVTTDDRGWYQRVKEKVDSGAALSSEYSDNDCYILLIASGFVLGILWAVAGGFGFFAAKHFSFVMSAISTIAGGTALIVFGILFAIINEKTDRMSVEYVYGSKLLDSESLETNFLNSGMLFRLASLFAFISASLQLYTNCLYLFSVYRWKKKRFADYKVT